MKSFYKYRLVPGSEGAIALQEEKEKMHEILDKDPEIKMGEYRDLLARVRHLQEELNLPSMVRVEES